MIRFIRALIYAAGAAILGSLFLDWLDRNKPKEKTDTLRLDTTSNEDQTIERLDDDTRQALLDELASQV